MYVLLKSSLLYTIHPSKAKEQGGSILTTALLFSTCSCNSPSADSIRIRRGVFDSLSSGGAGRFLLCKKHTLREQTAGRSSAPTSRRVQNLFEKNGRSHFYEIVRSRMPCRTRA